MVCFFVGILALSVLGLFLCCFCLVRGKKVASAQDFGWQSKGEGHYGSWFPFSCFFLFGDNSILFKYCLVRRPFCIFLLFSSDLRSRTFLFLLFSFDLWSRISLFLLFSSDLWSGTFFSLFSSEGKDGHSHPWSRFMVSWDFGSRLVERLDMIYVRIWPAVRG